MTATPAAACSRCGTEIAPTLLQCPSCGTLVHAERLQGLAREAEAAEQAGEVSAALGRWSEALTLLPTRAAQRQAVMTRIERLELRLKEGAPAGAKPAGPGGLRGLWVGLVATAVFVLGKAKLLLLGFTKLGTLFSMLAFLGVYWNVFGWPFALGMVLSIYVHEMGHVASLRHYGIPASAPMFIPGIGALVRLKAHPPTPAQDARVGLAGPIWGTGAALACLGIFYATGNRLFAGLVHMGSLLNLFNLIPVWQLDGARGIASQNRLQRALLAGVALVGFAVTREGVLLLVGIGLAIQCFTRAPEDGDRGALLQFTALLLVLAALGMVRGGELAGQ